MDAERASMWVYPWDLSDEGAAHVVEHIRSCGIGDLKVASIYHSGRFLLPHNPRRKICFPEPGSLYFDPDPLWYESSPIRPPIWSELDSRFWPRVRDELTKRGGSLTAWCLGLHNSGVGSRHPEVAVRNAFGDVLMTDLCAANPDVLQLLTNSVRDAVRATGADGVLLESFEYMPFMHGYHHEVIGVPVSHATGLLLTLCFCHWCTQRAKRADIDVERLRGWVKERVTSALADPFVPHAPLDWAEFRSWDGGQLGRYWDVRTDAVRGLLASVVGGVRGTTEARVSVLDFGPIYGTPPDGSVWQSGLDRSQVAEIADEIHPTFYLADPEQNQESVDSYLATCPKGVEVHAALRAILPQTHDADSLAASVAPLQHKVDGLSFYNYGFLGVPALEWIREIVRSFQPASSDVRS